MDLKDFLSGNETLFKEPIVLDYDYMPKLVPYRENEQREIALAIKPLLSMRNGKNVFVYGNPGIGKTLACKHVIKEVEEKYDIYCFYINCWKRNTSYKIALQLCEELDYPFIQNKKTDELFDVIKKEINKKAAVFVLDEIDKLEELSFLYFLLEEIYRKSIILITNNKEWLINLDSRIRSRLTPELLEFRNYNKEEIEGILRHRLKYAFYEGVFQEDAFKLVVEKTFEKGDIRVGLYLMREAGNNAEARSSKKITKEDVEIAIKKFADFSIKDKKDLDEDSNKILQIVKNNSGKKIGELFKIYQEQKGDSVYKTFQRKILKLEKAGFVKLKKIVGGAEGTTTIVNYAYKDLSDFQK
ncbi:MAG: AAA family ATPase [Candidatus Woesearchaeota archaeon]